MNIKADSQKIMDEALLAAKPDIAVKKALESFQLPMGRLILVAVGKAAWQMTKAASDNLGKKIDTGIVITKYDHSMGDLPNIDIYEAGHPVPDQNSFDATKKVIETVNELSSNDTVIFLLSGGGSALFEQPLVSNEILENITKELLACGADIVEINTIRKRLSAVKGGRFANICAPAKVYSIILSDIIGDPLDMIASGPAYPDTSTSSQALAIVKKYKININDDVEELLKTETPKELNNVETMVTGSVKQLCKAAEKCAKELGYKPIVLSASLRCNAKDAGSFLASIAQYYEDSEESLAFIAGGETVVQLTGSGKGGRNQEIALAAAKDIAGLKDTAVWSIGSDGTDGPTDAAGGYCDNTTRAKLEEQNIGIDDVLYNNDAYHALQKCDGLIKTGPTGTNVNDLSVLLIKRKLSN